MTDTTADRSTRPDLIRRAVAETFDFSGYLDWYRTNCPWPLHPESMRRKYDQIVVPEHEREALRRIAGNYRLLAMVDVGCPWVAANLTIVAGVVECSPAIELRVLHQPRHLNLAYAYPYHSGLPSTYILLDELDNELAVHAGTLGTPEDVLTLTTGYRERHYSEFARRFPGVHVADLPYEYTAGVLDESIEWRWQHIDQERDGAVQWLLNATR